MMQRPRGNINGLAWIGFKEASSWRGRERGDVDSEALLLFEEVLGVWYQNSWRVG